MNDTIDIMLSKEEQSRIGINADDVDHVRPMEQKLVRILEAYNKYQDEKRLVDLLWKMRREHIENRMSSYGKVLDYINEAIGKERFDQAMKDADVEEEA